MAHLKPKKILSLLNGIRNAQKRHWALSLGLLVLSVISAFGFLFIILESLYWFDPSVRQSLVNIFKTASLILALLYLMAILLLYLKPNFPSDESLARRIWSGNPEVRDTILNALQLSQQDKEEEKTSPALRQMAIEQADQLAEGLSAKGFVNAKSGQISLKTGISVFSFILLSLLLFNDGLLFGLSRLNHPGQSFVKPGIARLVLTGADSLVVVEGDSLTLRVETFFADVPGIRFHVEDNTGIPRTLSAQRDSMNPRVFTTLLGDIKRTGSFFASSGNLKSDTASFTVLPRPRITRLSGTVIPPPYTGAASFRIEEGIGDFRALPGSRYKVEIESNNALSRADVIFRQSTGNQVHHPLEARDKTASGVLPISREVDWWIRLIDRDGIESLDPVIWHINTLEDRFPEVTILYPDDGSMIPDQLVVPVVVNVFDDFGVSKMNLRYTVQSNMFGPDTLPESEFYSFPLAYDIITEGQAVSRTMWSLADLPLLPTDEVQFFVEAWDNDAWSGPKRSKSPLYRLLFPSVEELFTQTEKTEEEILEDVESSLRQVEETREKMEETLSRLRSNPEELSWDEAVDLQEAMKKQEQVLEQIDEMAKTLEEMRQQAQSHDLMNEELLEKYSRLQELMEEIATPELREAMQKLNEALEEMDSEKIREALEDMSFDQESLLKNLERNLAIMEQLKAEKKMDELAKRVEDLLERQEKVSQRTENADNKELNELSEIQKNIQEDYQKTNEKTSQTSQELNELNQAIADSLAKIAEEMEKNGLQEMMQEASEAMKSGKQQQSKESSEMTEEMLEQLALRMRKLQQQMNDMNKSEVASQIDQLFQSLLLVSQQQEELRRTSENLGIASPRYRDLAADQFALKNSLDIVNKEVEKVMESTFFVGVAISGNIVNARYYMEEAINRYSDRTPRKVTDQQTQVLILLHRSMKALLESKKQMQNSGSGTGYQEMMQKLSQMAQQQQMLNQGSQQAPVPMPGQQGKDMMMQMAARQRALAEQMRKMEEDARSMEDMLGNLDGLGDAMEAVAKDMEDKNVDERTRKLQQRILQRLLDSQLSLQEREYSKERTGKVAENMPHIAPGMLPEEIESIIRYRMKKALESDYRSKWKETIKNYYRSLEQENRKP